MNGISEKSAENLCRVMRVTFTPNVARLLRATFRVTPPTCMNALMWSAVVLSCSVTSRVAQAQRGNASDVTGVNITGSTQAGGAFVPSGTVLVSVPRVPSVPGLPEKTVRLTPGVASLVTTLMSGSARGANGALIPAEAGVLVVQLGVAQAGSPVATICCSAVGQALMSGVGAPPAPVVEQFLAAFAGVLLNPTPRAVTAAVAAWNALVNGAAEEYLRDPPAEFRAVGYLLDGLVK